LKFIKEEPAKEDLFKGQAHTLVSKNVYDSIKTDEVYVVGLEGDLGSGKSSILNNVISLSNDDDNTSTHFVEFDTELYHNNNVNKALVNILYDELKEVPELKSGENAAKLKNIKDRALGNIVDYKRTVTSNLSWWMVTFVIASLCSIEMISDGVKAIGQTWSALSLGNVSFSRSNFLQISFMFSPVLWWVIWGIKRHQHKDNKDKIPPKFVDIFKRQVPERIDEVLEVPNEVGSYELKNALNEFVAVIPDNTVIILVIDNLDRVPEHSLPQVWSDLEVFTQIKNNKFKLIIPHSTKHVARAISESDNHVEGMEFISKRIPIKHRVPPLLQSDWRGVLKIYSEAAELTLSDEQILIISNIIQLWLPEGMLQITPRYLKRQINEIVSILFSRPQIPAPIACAYINMTQYGQLSLEELLVDTPEEPEDNKPGDKHAISRRRTYKQLEKFTSVTDDIKSFFVEAHFQADGELANSEILASQLDTYLIKSDYENFILSDRYGYRDVLLNYLPDAEVNYLIDLLVKITAEDSPQKSDWLKTYLKKISSEINGIDIFELSERNNKLNPVFELLNQLEVISTNLAQLSLDKYAVSKVLVKIQNTLKQALTSDFSSETHDINIYNAIYKTVQLTDNKIGKKLLKLNPEAFVNVYWPERDKFPLWDEESNLTEDEKLEALEIINQFSEVPTAEQFSLLQYIKGACRVGRAIVYSDNYSPVKQVFTSFLPPTINELGNDIVDLYYFTEIYKNNSLTINHQQLNQVQVEYRGKAISFVIVNEINKGTPEVLAPMMGQLNAAQYIATDYEDYLTDDLVMVSSFSKIISAMGNAEVKLIINDAVKKLIENDLVGVLTTKELYSNYYKLLSPLFESDKSTLFNWMLNNWSISQIKSLDDFSPELIKDAAEQQYTEINLALIDLYESRYEVADWTEILVNPSDLDLNEANGYLACDKVRTKSKLITDALKALILQNQLNSESINFIKLMVKTLPVKAINMLVKYMGTTFFDEKLNTETRELIINFAASVEDDLLNINSNLSDKEQKVICDFINSSSDTSAVEWLGMNLQSIEYWTDENKLNLSTFIAGNELNQHFDSIMKELEPKVVEDGSAE
jgi:parvulin-like peptidyl-prolyl isomerase